MATARVKKIPIITRDSIMLDLATRAYIGVIVC